MKQIDLKTLYINCAIVLSVMLVNFIAFTLFVNSIYG